MKRALPPLLVILTALACGGSPPPSAPAPAVPTGQGTSAPMRTLSGVVSDSIPPGGRPVPGAIISTFYTAGSSGRHGGDAATDAEGRYRVAAPDGVFALLTVDKAGYVQPCAATATVAGDTTLDIQLVPDAAAAAGVPPGLRAVSPTVSGVVFESTPEGRQPVAGARIVAERLLDLTMATTITDAAGRYLLCAIPQGSVGITATGPGGFLAEAAVVVTGDTVLDLEIKTH
jgi:Carboxypeptidase regulatory-like domain